MFHKVVLESYAKFTGKDVLESLFNKNATKTNRDSHIRSDVTLLFEHSPSRASEIEHFVIFSCPRENKLGQRFFVKFNLLLLFLIS